MRPLFTIVTPAYNRERFITETLYSVLNQKFTDWNMVIVDDGSKDKTVKVIDNILKVTKQAHKVKLVQFPKNRGCAAATIEGIKHVDGIFFTVVDSDDILYPDSLSSIAKQLMKNRNVKFLWSKFVQAAALNHGIMQNGYSKELPKGQTLRKALSGGWWGAQHQKVCHTETYRLSKYPILEKYQYAVDFQLAVAMAETHCPVKFLDKVTYFLRLHQWRMSNTVRTLQRSMYDKLRLEMQDRYTKDRKKARQL